MPVSPQRKQLPSHGVYLKTGSITCFVMTTFGRLSAYFGASCTSCHGSNAHYLDKAVTTGFAQESVRIAVSSMLECFHFCGVGAPETKPLVVAEWNEVMAWQVPMSPVDS